MLYSSAKLVIDQLGQAVAVDVLGVDAHARLQPGPSRRSAAPEVSVASSKVPSPLLRKRKFGLMSLATKRSTLPSPLRSAATTPKPWPSARALRQARGPRPDHAVVHVGEGPVAVVPVEEVLGRPDRVRGRAVDPDASVLVAAVVSSSG